MTIRRSTGPRAFTIIELLVVVSIIALLVGILLPAISSAREQAKVSISQANLRNLGTAHQSYASQWGDRQYTAVNDNIASYGAGVGVAFDNFGVQHSSGGGINDAGNHPPTYLGYGWREATDEYRMYAYKCNRGMAGNASLTLPIVFAPGITEYFGAFRLPNALNFSQYVSGRFYDRVFYAPKDEIVIEAAWVCFDSPDQYCPNAKIAWGLGNPAWSSYCTSPAGMFNPQVLAHDDDDDPNANGAIDPWSIEAGFRSPSFSQCLYPSLKTHMLEHHWLQNAVADCNPGFTNGTYEGCEPYYFNHAWESSPVTLFYDGHVESVGIRNAMRADGRMRAQTDDENWGLWSKDTAWQADGYLSDYGYDQAESSFHILTTDGIRGRDISAD